MALTEPEVGLCNQSLGKIAAKAFVFGDVTSNQSVKSLLFFEQTRNALLRKFVWPFARKRLRLVSSWLTATVYNTDQYTWEEAVLYKCAIAHTAGTFATDLGAGNWVADTTDDTFGHIYDKPANCRRLVENNDINNTNVNWNWYGTYTYPKSNRPADTWVLEGNTILTQDTDVDIVYIDTISDTTEWDDLFTELFITVLAKKLLAALAGSGPGTASHRTDLNNEIKVLTKDAETVGAQEGNNSGSSDWNNARFS
jgi:hypothetical protein